MEGKEEQLKYKCSECGQIHDDWPALGFRSPDPYEYLTEHQKSTIAELNPDFCEIRYEDQTDRFIRVVLFQKVNDHCEDLEYGVWVSLSEKSYNDYKSNFNNENHETGYFGWLCNSIPQYEEAAMIPTDVMTKKGNSRPEIFPHESSDHPLVKDYYDGITKEETERRIQGMLNTLK
ncbi:DUF2199 domain-containing protein [Leptobacterium flavescens]|uniref:DUF2199 domain-containing protein n=1 Tax=Leptobacterium flavescens TaxID=472055 RepID=A0A6P0UR34_9FLAO|nr:DUF2199 domain-containing protein [Leptobacterium flavescens]NER12876.1 DUF2199 domain-containing protein [Leptobacterium flavescens]